VLGRGKGNLGTGLLFSKKIAEVLVKADQRMQLHTGAEHFGNVIKRGIAKQGCS